MILPFIFSVLSSSVRIFLARAPSGVAWKNLTVSAGRHINFFSPLVGSLGHLALVPDDGGLDDLQLDLGVVAGHQHAMGELTQRVGGHLPGELPAAPDTLSSF